MPAPTDLLIHSVTRVRPVTTPDAWNAEIESSTTRTTGIPARLQQDTRAEIYFDARTPTEQRWTMFTNETDWDRRDRVEWTGPNGLLVFEMYGDPEPVYDGTAFHHVEATLRIVDG